MIDRLLYAAVAVALASVFVFDGTFSTNLHRASSEPIANMPFRELAGWQLGLVCAPLAYLLGRLLRRL